MKRTLWVMALIAAAAAVECGKEGPVAPSPRLGAGAPGGTQITITGDLGHGGVRLMGGGLGLAVGGTGLNTQPATLSVDVPGSPLWAYLFWSGVSADMGGDNEILLDGIPVTGTALAPEVGTDGTWTVAFYANVLSRISSGMNSFSVSGLSLLENDGVGIMVAHDAGTRSEVLIGIDETADLFWAGMPDPAQRNSEVHTIFLSEPLSQERAGRVTIMAGNCEDGHGDAVHEVAFVGSPPSDIIALPGSTIGTDVLESGFGAQWDIFQHDIVMPINSNGIATQIASPPRRQGDSGVFVAMALEVNPGPPPPPPPGGFRTIGFWKHQVNVALGAPGHAQIDADSMLALLAGVQAVPGVDCVDFDQGDGTISLQDADAVLDAPNPMTMEQRARRQVLAALLNFVAFNGSNGSLMVDTTCDCVPDMSYQDFLDDALDVLCPPGSSSRSEYKRIKDMADCLNNQESCGP